MVVVVVVVEVFMEGLIITIISLGGQKKTEVMTDLKMIIW